MRHINILAAMRKRPGDRYEEVAGMTFADLSEAEAIRANTGVPVGTARAGAVLNVRALPSTEAEIVGTLEHGQLVYVWGSTDAEGRMWSVVSLAGDASTGERPAGPFGWVAASWLVA